MTDPMVPRASTSIALRIVESVSGSLTRLIVGAGLFTPGIIGYLHEMNHGYACDEAMHKGDISVFVGLMLAAALVVVPSFGKSLTNVFTVVFPNGLPILGGRRASDPPAPQ